MAKLWVANTSKQHVDFCYRLGEEKNYRTEKIPIGHQVLIGGGRLSPEQIAYVLEQHADKNIRDATQVSRLKDYVGLCYRLEKPVDLEKLHFMFDQNDERLNAAAEDRREDTAAAIGAHMEERSHELGVPLNRSEVETVEDTKGGTPRIANGFEVLREGTRSRHTGGRRTRGSRSAPTDR